MTERDRVAEAHEQLTHAVEALVSGEDWRAMLDVASRFHTYSPHNALLILAQRPDASRVAGYRTWQSLARQVRKGEHGIKILAPIVRRIDASDTPNAALDAEGVEVVATFKVVHVLDLAQTEGEPVPDVAPRLLAGDAPSALWDALAAEVGAAGFALVRGDCGEANGITDYAALQVTVRADVEPAQATKTLAHELAHVLLHGPDHEPRLSRDRAEVEAESVAYLVCAGAGMASDDYSFPYVARWAAGDVAAVQAAAERAIATARGVLTAAGLTSDEAVSVPA